MSVSNSHGQTVSSRGNLIRIGFGQKDISYGDTLGAWNDQSVTISSVSGSGYSYSRYFDHFSTPQASYFLKKYESWYSSIYISTWHGERQVEKEGSLKGIRFGETGAGWDVLPPFMIDRTKIIAAQNGNWLISGNFGNAFVYNNDTLTIISPWEPSGPNQTMTERMTSIIGKVNDRYLAATRNISNIYDYYLISLDHSPYIDSSTSTRITITNTGDVHGYSVAVGIKKIANDLYAVLKEYGQGIDIYSFSDTTLSYQKTLLKDEIFVHRISNSLWDFRNGMLYNYNGFNLIRYEFRNADTSFVNKKVLLDSLNDSFHNQESNFGIDKNLRYAAKIVRTPGKTGQDTLKIFDIDKSQFISSISLGSINGAFKPVVDSPYVYVHQILEKHTGINDDKGRIIKEYALTAYPNPFNSAVKISFTLPEDQNAELNIYDLLGRKVASLVNGQVKKGSHEILFDANHLSSGIYLYTLRSGSYVKTNKLILLK